MIPLLFFSFWKNILISLNLFLLFFITLFTAPLDENGFTPLPVSSPPSSYRSSFPSLPIPCSSFSFPSVRSSALSAVSQRTLMPLSLHVLNRISFLISKSCSSAWLTLPNPSARPSTLPLLRSLLLILPALNPMSMKIIRKTLTPLSENSKLSIKIAPLSIPIRWPMPLCPHNLLPVLMLNRCISIAISVMPTSLPSLPTA